jgi:hypothetical protein
MQNSFAESINDAGVVVGYATTIGAPYGSPGSLGVIWNGTTPTALDTLLDATGAGWTITDVYGINDLGQNCWSRRIQRRGFICPSAYP